ncbi:MAG: leucine-rich repeat protein [Lachnospiraceae bacterium]|nr:leucine-rich repeat protein [Lachnospiraceae bacterium]
MKSENRKKWKRILALLLTVVMCLSLIPVNAFAQEVDDTSADVDDTSTDVETVLLLDESEYLEVMAGESEECTEGERTEEECAIEECTESESEALSEDVLTEGALTEGAVTENALSENALSEDELIFSVEEVSEVPAAVSADEAESGAASGTCGEQVTWVLDSDGTLTISGKGEMNDYASVDDYDVDEDGYDKWVRLRNPWYESRGLITSVVIESGVTSIGSAAFEDCENLVNVSIPETVTEIGKSAFAWCYGLVSITLPDGLTGIGANAFLGCGSLTDLVLPDSLTSIGEDAFSYCTSLTAIVIPAGVTSIDAFSGCTSLTSVTLPEGLLCIEWGAFSGCTSLTDITLPESLISIEGGAFIGCSSLTAITIPGNVISIGEYEDAFAEWTSLVNITVSEENTVYSSKDGILYDKSGTTLLRCPVGRTGEFEIPSGVTAIGKRAFSGCAGLTKITLPKGVKKISSCAFEDCTGLTEVSLPSSLKTIGTWAFSGCTSLTEITIPNKVTYLRGSTFSGCTGLTSVTLSSKLTKLGSSVFYGCSNLTEITIPDGVTAIAGGTFHGCERLTRIYIPSSVTSIGGGAFRECTSLSDVYYAGKKKAFQAITVDYWNEALTSAVIHYNATSMDAAVATCKVTALTNTANGVKITWSSVEDADGYYVYRKTSSGTYKKIKTIKSATTQSYTDKAVKDESGTLYYYKVCAYIDGTKGSGIGDQIVRLTSTVITSMKLSEDGVLELEWEKVEGVSGYQIKIIDIGYGSTSFTVRGKKITSVSVDVGAIVGTLAVQIRTYKKVTTQTDSGSTTVKYLSAWSSKVTQDSFA